MKLLKSLIKKFKNLSKPKKIIILIESVFISFFIYNMSTLIIDTIIIKNTSNTINNENYQSLQENNTSLINKILLGEGHPIYAESIKNIFSYAMDPCRCYYTSVNFLGEKKYNEYNDHAVLYIGGFEFSDGIDHITDIVIHPTNIDYNMEEKEAVELANKYLPTNIINKYYKQPTTDIYTPESEPEKSYILIRYEFNDEIYKDIDTLSYQAPINILLEKENNKVTCIKFFNSLPKWMIMADWKEYEIN